MGSKAIGADLNYAWPSSQIAVLGAANNLLDSLTNRELRILLEISNGLKNKDIAEKLYLSEKTIKNYVTTIFKKIGVEDRVHATIFAINNGIEEYYNRRVHTK